MTKPECKLIGEDGNVFNLIGKVVKTLERSGLRNEATEFKNKAYNCKSYDDVLNIIQNYVKII